MRVLLDEQFAASPRQGYRRHDVSTVQQCGWAGLKNGDLLRVAAGAGFEVFVTADRNLQFQQNLSLAQLGIVLFVAPSNAFEDLRPVVPKLLAAFRSNAQASCYV